MHTVLIVGAGKIGSLIAFLLARSNDYKVYLSDIQKTNPYEKKFQHLPNYTYLTLDAKDINEVKSVIKKYKIEAVISSLPYYCNISIACLLYTSPSPRD